MSWLASMVLGVVGAVAWRAGVDFVAFRRRGSMARKVALLFDVPVDLIATPLLQRAGVRRPRDRYSITQTMPVDADGPEAIVPLPPGFAVDHLLPRTAHREGRRFDGDRRIVLSTPRGYGGTALLERLRGAGDREPSAYLEWIDAYLDPDLTDWQRTTLGWWLRSVPRSTHATGSLEHCLRAVRHEGQTQLWEAREWLAARVNGIESDLHLDLEAEQQFVRGVE